MIDETGLRTSPAAQVGAEKRRTPEKEGMFHAAMGFATAIDNYLILQVKMGKFAADPKKLEAVTTEAAEYKPIIDRLSAAHPELQELMSRLAAIHEKLWYIEDRKRVIERGEEEEVMIPRLLSEGEEVDLVEYLQLSRQVSKFNDIRASIKREMNTVTGSAIIEVKSHKTVTDNTAGEPRGEAQSAIASASIEPEVQPSQVERPLFEIRPWGRFDILSETAVEKRKRITVNPGQRLSLQSHQHRAEEWTVESGEADVTLNDEVIRLGPGESIIIPQGARHRASNPGDVPLVFTEIQTGTYFGEDDIKRYEDDYERA